MQSSLDCTKHFMLCYAAFNTVEIFCRENTTTGHLNYAGKWCKNSNHQPGGSDCFNLSAFSESKTQSVYRYLEQRTLNFTTSLLLFIFTDRASFLLAVRRKSLISCICLG